MKKIFISGLILFFIDSLYLYTIKSFFNKQIKNIQNEEISLDYVAAGLCYVFLIFALYYFIIKNKKPVYDAFLLGFIIYMVFELTNKAIIKNWEWKTVFIDGVWGGLLFYSTTYLSYKIFEEKF